MPDQVRELIDSVRARLQAELAAQLGVVADRHQQELADTRRAAEAEAELRWSSQVEATRADVERLASRRVSQEAKQRLADAVREIDAARSASDALTATLRAAAREAPRAALFVGAAGAQKEWVVDGASSFIDPREAAVAIPLTMDGEQVAMLYGHEVDRSITAEGWRDGLAVIAAHGASRLACITATRTAQAAGWLSGRPPVTSGSTPSSDEEEQAARRYARLLVSEIKLYNESAVKAGREHRDLARRLRPEIDRARRLYEQRIPPTLAARDLLFEHEVVQTLAGGDGSLLGP